MTEETGVGKETSDCRADLTPFKEWREVKGWRGRISGTRVNLKKSQPGWWGVLKAKLGIGGVPHPSGMSLHIVPLNSVADWDKPRGCVDLMQTQL